MINSTRVIGPAVLLASFVLAVGAPRPVASQPPNPRLYKSGPIQTDAAGSFVWVANAHSDSFARIDTGTATARNFPLPDPARRDRPLGISVSDDGAEVWVAAHDADAVYVADANGRVAETIDLPYGSGPYSVALSPPDTVTGRQEWALVTLHRAEAVAAIRVSDHAVTLLDGIFKSPTGIAWIEGGREAWITHIMVAGEHPHLTRIAIDEGVPTVTANISVGAASPRHSGQLSDPGTERNVAEGGYLNWRGHPVELPGKSELWLPTQYHNMTEDRVSAHSTIQVSLRKLPLDAARVSAADKAVLTAAHVHDPTRGDNNPPWLGYGWDADISGAVDIGFTGSGEALHAVLVGEQSNDIVVFPTSIGPTRSASSAAAPKLPEVGVGARPMGVVVHPAQHRAYVYNDLSHDVTVVDLQSPTSPVRVGEIPLAPPTDLLADEVVATGARLFFSSDDPRIASGSRVACASCHINGEHDGRRWAFHRLPPGTAGQQRGPRGTTSLLGLGQTFTASARDPVTGWGLLHRSGDRDEVQDFDHTFASPHMGGTGFITGGARDELGSPNAGLNGDLDALARYVESVPPLQKSPHRSSDGTLTEAAVRGATMFMGGDPASNQADADCASCHIPRKAFQDGGFHDVGSRREPEERELNAASRQGCSWCASTPSLVGAWDTAPYEGSYRWTESFVDLLDDFGDPERPAPHGRTGRLTHRQLQDLAAFVMSIDGRTTGAEVEAARDTQPPRIARVAVTSPQRLEVWFTETVAPDSVGIGQAYSLADSSGASLPIRAIDVDVTAGDRVTLATDPMTPGRRYTLRATSAIRDAAGWTEGGQSNVLDESDPANTVAFSLSAEVTVTLGSSGGENIEVRVHDSSPVGPGLGTWSHDRVQLFRDGTTVVPGLLRFDWREAFVAATGVQNSKDIQRVQVRVPGQMGDAARIEARRVLLPWSDPATGGDWNQNPTGGPTWRDHQHPDGRWNTSGAGALGGRGDRRSDYNGTTDLAGHIDDVAEWRAVNGDLVLDGQDVTDAFRFWFDNQDLDYGYALRLMDAAPAPRSAVFRRSEADLRMHGARLEITYRITTASIVPPSIYLPHAARR